MFGTQVRWYPFFSIVARSIYSHFWDNWNRRGAKAQKRRDDYLEDFINARTAFEQCRATNSSEALELGRNLLRTCKKHIDIETIYGGKNKVRNLVEKAGKIEDIVKSAKERRGE